MSTVDLYLPKTGRLRFIVPGSGIAGLASEQADRLQISYEGNVYRTEQLQRYADRCLHASERLLHNAPTIARAFVHSHDVAFIGTFDTVFGEAFLAEGAERLLAAWLDVPAVDPTELVTSDQARISLRTVRGWTPEQRKQLQQLPAHEREKYQRAGLI